VHVCAPFGFCGTEVERVLVLIPILFSKLVVELISNIKGFKALNSYMGMPFAVKIQSNFKSRIFKPNFKVNFKI
jgi:hypothetical protein